VALARTYGTLVARINKLVKASCGDPWEMMLQGAA
jgi:hypothetical protein